jgi:hypothetical protein
MLIIRSAFANECSLTRTGGGRPRNDVEASCDGARKGSLGRTIKKLAQRRRDAETQRKKKLCSMFPVRPSALLFSLLFFSAPLRLCARYFFLLSSARHGTALIVIPTIRRLGA